MNCLLIYPEEIDGSKVLIQGERRGLLLERHNLSQGLELKAGVFEGSLGRAKVVSTSEALEMEFQAESEPPPRLEVSLICGLCRPQTVKKVIQSSILFGIEQLHFVSTEAGEKSYLDSKIWEPEALKRELELGLEQAVDTVAPKIVVHRKFHKFINDELSSLNPADHFCLLADTQTAVTEGFGPGNFPMLLAVGPEGGWADKEREVFLSRSFKPISLGSRMLRVETAATGLLGAAQAAKSSCFSAS